MNDSPAPSTLRLLHPRDLRLPKAIGGSGGANRRSASTRRATAGRPLLAGAAHVGFLLIAATLTLLAHRTSAAQAPSATPHPALGQHSIPGDVDWARPIFQTAFDDAAELKNWQLEGGSPPLPAPRPPTVVRFQENPIIRHEMLPGPAGTSICYPSVIRVPDWLPNPLGKYYLYFADHKGTYIRLAYADRMEGPWTIHEPGTLRLEQMVAVARANAGGKESEVEGKHLASPDVQVDDEKREIRMYFHFSILPREPWGHRSGVAVSPDGRRFQPIGTKPIGQPYLRVFRRDGFYYALDRIGAITRSRDGLTDFESGNPEFAAAVGHKVRGSGLPAIGTRNALARARGEEDVLPGEMRHSAVKIDGDVLTVYFSRGGDLPEHIMCAQASLKGDWKTWRLSPPVTVLLPEMDYEGGKMPLGAPTNQGMQKRPRPLFRELRDPFVFRDQGKTYLLYSVAGEGGIAGAILTD